MAGVAEVGLALLLHLREEGGYGTKEARRIKSNRVWQEQVQQSLARNKVQ